MGNSVSTRYTGYQKSKSKSNKKITQCYKWLTFFGVAAKWGPIDSETLQAPANALSYSPELDSKILLMNTLHTWAIEHE